MSKRWGLPVERWSLVQNVGWTPIEGRARPAKKSVTRSRRPGEFTEPIHEATVAGLVVVLLGFYFYEADDLKRSSRIPDHQSVRTINGSCGCRVANVTNFAWSRSRSESAWLSYDRNSLVHWPWTRKVSS